MVGTILRRFWVAALVAAFVALPPERSAAIGGSDRVDITSASASDFSASITMSQGCGPNLAACNPIADTNLHLNLAVTGLKISGLVNFTGADAACNATTGHPCMTFEVAAGGSGGPGVASNVIVLTGTNRPFNADLDFSGVLTGGNETLIVRVAAYTSPAKTVLLTEEFFQVNYLDPSGAAPVVCITNMPAVNELGRRVTRSSSFNFQGRVIPNVGGTRIANPPAGLWVSQCSQLPPAGPTNLSAIEVLNNGIQAASITDQNLFYGASVNNPGNPVTFCDEPVPALTTPGACTPAVDDAYSAATFTFSHTLPTNASTVLRLRARNGLDLTSADNPPTASGLDDNFTIIQDSTPPTLGNGNFTVLKSDFSTVDFMQSPSSGDVTDVARRLNLLGRMSDTTPGRMAYVSYDAKNDPSISSVNGATGQVVISTSRYNQLTDNGELPLKAGDVVYFQPGEANSDKSFRVSSVSALGSYGYQLTLNTVSYTGATLQNANLQTTVGVASVQNATTYTVTINGQNYSILSDGSATATEIVTALTGCINTQTGCTGSPPNPPVTATNNGTTLTLNHDAPPAGFVATVSAELSVASTGEDFIVRRTAFAPLRPSVSAGGVLNFDDNGADEAAFDALVARGAPVADTVAPFDCAGEGDWIYFAPSDPAANAGRWFCVLGYNAGAKTITVSTTSGGGQGLIAEAADASRTFLRRRATGLLDGDDAQGGYNCDPCTNESWAANLYLNDGPNTYALLGFDDSGRTRSHNAQVNFTDGSVSVALPDVTVSRMFFYTTLAAAQADTAPNTNPSIANCNNPGLATGTGTCQDISLGLPSTGRILGQAEGVKIVGVIELDPAGPSYPDVLGGSGPNLALLGAGGGDLSANVVAVNSATSDALCDVAPGPDPVGYCFAWYMDINVPIIVNLPTSPGAASVQGSVATSCASLPAGTTTTRLRVIADDLISTIGLSSSDKVTFSTNQPATYSNLPIVCTYLSGGDTYIEVAQTAAAGSVTSYFIPRAAPDTLRNVNIQVTQDNLATPQTIFSATAFNRDRTAPQLAVTGFFEDELNVNFAPTVSISDAHLDMNVANTGIRLYRGTDLESDITRVNVDLDAIVPDGGMDESAPLNNGAFLDGDCCNAALTPAQWRTQCTGLPAQPIPVCADNFYSFGAANTLCGAAGPANRVNGANANYPFRVVCSMPSPSNISFSGMVLGDTQNERGGYRFEVWGADTAVPPNRLTTNGPNSPLDFHFGAVVTESQQFINDFVLIFLNEGGSSLNPIDICPNDLFGNPQSLFECVMDPVLTTLNDNPTDIRGGQDVLGFFFEVFSFVIGSAGGSFGDVTDDAAFNALAATALGAFQEIFPTFFDDGSVDSDLMTVLNLVKNGIDRGVFDDIPRVTMRAVIDPDNDARTADGMESLQAIFQTMLQNDGGAFRVTQINELGIETSEGQNKSSSPLIRVTPALLDLLTFEDVRGTLDVVNRLRFINVPTLDANGLLVEEKRLTLPLLYAIIESIYDDFDPDLLIDASGRSAVLYDPDGVGGAAAVTRCYQPYGSGMPVCRGSVGSGCATTSALITKPQDCRCSTPGNPAGASFCIDDATEVVSPNADTRKFTQAVDLLSSDQCAAVDPTVGTDKSKCLARSGGYTDPNSALFEDPTMRNLRTIVHQLLDNDNVAGVSTLTSLLDIILCVFEPVRAGTTLRASSMERFALILAVLVNQTGTRSYAECSAGGQFLEARLTDVACPNPGGWNGSGGERLTVGGRGVECPAGEELRLDIFNAGLAPGEYCTQGELTFPQGDAISTLTPGLEVFTDPSVLEQIARVLVDFPDTDLILSGIVASSDAGLLKRTLLAVAQIFDTYDNGIRSGIQGCGTPGYTPGSCREPGQPIAEIALNGGADLLSSARAPLVTCATAGTTCASNPAPGTNILMSSHDDCKAPGQKVFCHAEFLPISVMLDTFDELFIDNPPAACEFYQSLGCGPGCGTYDNCILIRNLDFDKLNSVWDFLDEFVNEFMNQPERDSLVEALPTMMGGHQNSTTGLRTLPDYQRIIPGPRPLVTSTTTLSDPDLFRNVPTGTLADAQIWPPDRAFPSPLVSCGGNGTDNCNSSATAVFCVSGQNCATGWRPAAFMPLRITGRNHGRNPYDKFLCDGFDCCNGGACTSAGTSACGGNTGAIGKDGIALTNQNDCETKGRLSQKLVNPYFGCWNKETGNDRYRWKLDVQATRSDAVPETPADCFDSPDMTRGLDEQIRTNLGISIEAYLLGGLAVIDGNKLLSDVSGFSNPQYMPSTNLTYKVFGLGTTIPKSEVLNLFAALRAARGILASPLIGTALRFKQDCTGFYAAETGSYTWSVAGNTASPNDDHGTSGDGRIARRRLANSIDRTPALEPLIRNVAFEPLQRMLNALASIPNPPANPPDNGLYQSKSTCYFGQGGNNGGVAGDVYQTNHPKNPLRGSTRQHIWGQSPVILQFLSTFENTGYAQLSLYELMVAIEEGPEREIMDLLFEVLGDWRGVTADIDTRIPPGSNFMRVVLDGVDNLISPRDGTTVPCGADGSPCGGTDGKGFSKNGDTDGDGTADAQPFLYPLFPVIQKMAGVRRADPDVRIRACTGAGAPHASCPNSNFAVIDQGSNIDYSAVVDCGATSGNGWTCDESLKPDFVYVKCQGGASTNCDRSDPAGTLVGAGYSYLGHTFRVVDVPNTTTLIVEKKAWDNPVVTIAADRKINTVIQTFTHVSSSLGLRAIARVIIDDFNQDPDIPGADVAEVDEVVADLIRCDTEGFFIDTVAGYLDQDTANGDLRTLRNAIFTLNANPSVRDATLDTIGAALGATGGGDIEYSDINNHPDPSSCIPTVGSAGICKGDAPLVNIVPFLRDGALADPPEQFALQESFDNLVNPFNPDSNDRLSSNPAGCMVNSKDIPTADCVAFIDPILDAVVQSAKLNTTARVTGNEPKLAEVAVSFGNNAPGEVPDPRDKQPPTSPVTAFRAQLTRIMGGAGVSGLDTYQSADSKNGDCELPSGSPQPNRPDGILDDCNTNGVPDFLSRGDDGTPDFYADNGGNPNWRIGNWFYNDSGAPIDVVTVWFYHDGATKDSPDVDDRIGRVRVLASSVNPLSITSGTSNTDACFDATDVDDCGPGRLRVEDFYLRERDGIQPVSVYPPLRVNAGQFVYVSVQQRNDGATATVPLRVGVDSNHYGEFVNLFGGVNKDLTGGGGCPNNCVQAGDNLDFIATGTDTFSKVGAFYTPGVPIVRAGFTRPITLSAGNAAFEQGIPLVNRLFDKPQTDPGGNPELLRPVEAIMDALLALLLPLDVAPKNIGNNATSIPASCQDANGNENFVFLPHIIDQGTGLARRQRCNYFTGGPYPPTAQEMEQGLGCAEVNGTTSDGVPCWATPRGMEPVDLDASGDFVTPLELAIPFVRRLFLAVFADPIMGDGIDPDIVLFDTFGFFDLILGKIPGISCDEVNVLGGVCNINTGEVTTPSALTPMIDRLLILAKVLAEVSFDSSPGLAEFRFFDDPADKTCSGGPVDPDAKCNAITANLFDVISALSQPVTLYDRVTGLSDPEPRPILVRLLDNYIDAFFPPPVTPPVLPPKELPPRVSLDTAETSIQIREGYGAGGPGACVEVAAGGGSATALPVCTYTMDLTVYHGQAPTIQNTVNEIQTVTFSQAPISGTWQLVYNPGVETTVAIAYNASASEVRNALNGLPSLSNVDVTGDAATGYRIVFNGADGGQDQLPLTANDSLVPAAVNIVIDQTCDFGAVCQLSGSQPLADAVVSVTLPPGVESGAPNTLHVAAFNDVGRSDGSMLAKRLWRAAYTVGAGGTNDVLEYGIMIPSISHVRNIGLNVLFDNALSGSCVTGANSPFNTETVRQYEALPAATQTCLRNFVLKFGNKTDQAGRPAETWEELDGALDKFILRRIPLISDGVNEANYAGRTIGGAQSGIFLEFDSSFGAPRGRAEAYISFIRIVNDNLQPGDPGYVIQNIYSGTTALPTGNEGATTTGLTGYTALDEDGTCDSAGLPGACNGAAGTVALNTRRTSLICPSGECPVEPACGVWTALGGGNAGSRGCNAENIPGSTVSPGPVYRFRTDANGRLNIPIKASLMSFANLIQAQVVCGDYDGDGDCDEQIIGSSAALEVQKGGDSAPVTYKADTRYPPRPMEMAFESLDGQLRPVYQTTAVCSGVTCPDLSLPALKTGEPPEADAFFLDTRVLDQQGDSFAGYRTLATTFQYINLPIDYAVVRRPALELRSLYNTTAAVNYSVIGTGDPSSTGPYISKAGDYLEYEVYIPDVGGNIVGDSGTTTSPNAGIDIQSANPNNGSRDLRNVAIPGMPQPGVAGDVAVIQKESGNPLITSGRALDQNLRAADPRAELANAGTPRAGENFYYRRIPLPEGFELSRADSNRSADTASRVFAALWALSPPSTSSMSNVYFRQIRIGNDNTAQYSIYDEHSGRKVLRLSSSPCNDYWGGEVNIACPTTTKNTCLDGSTGTRTFVFEDFTGLDVGDKVVMMSGKPPCNPAHQHRLYASPFTPSAAVDHDAGGQADCSGGGDFGAQQAITDDASPNNDGGMRWTQMYKNAADAPTANPHMVEVCDVSRDPVVVFRNGSPSWDWRNGAAMRVNSQRVGQATGYELELEFGGAGYTWTTMCSSTEYASGNDTDADRCRPTTPPANAQAGTYGVAVGEGRFCPNGAGNANFGKRCASSTNMHQVTNAGDVITDDTDGRSHVAQRAKSVRDVSSNPTGLYRFVYTMGVSSGRQTVVVRTNKSGGIAAGLDPNGEIQAYAHLLDTQEFDVVGLPPPVPAQIVFNTAEFPNESKTNGTVGQPLSLWDANAYTNCAADNTCQDLHVQVRDQYGAVWQKPIPIKWNVTLPKNAIRIAGFAHEQGAYLGLKLNTGITGRPRWFYPNDGRIGHSRDFDLDVSGGAYTVSGDRGLQLADDVENSDNDAVLRFKPGSVPTGLLPGDTVRLGYDGGQLSGEVYTARVKGVYDAFVEFEDIRYLGGDCGVYDQALETDPNLRTGFECSGCGGCPASGIRNQQAFITNPHTGGDDFPCNENAGNNLPVCEDYARWGVNYPGRTVGQRAHCSDLDPLGSSNNNCSYTSGSDSNGNDNYLYSTLGYANGLNDERSGKLSCVGGNFDRGADGTWRRVTQYRSANALDDPGDAVTVMPLHRHCYELNFVPAASATNNTVNTNGDPSYAGGSGSSQGNGRKDAQQGNMLIGRDVTIGDVRMEYNAFGAGSFPQVYSSNGGSGGQPASDGAGNCAWQPPSQVNVLIIGTIDAGGVAWGCLPGQLTYTMLVPDPNELPGNPTDYRAQVGVDYSGLRMTGGWDFRTEVGITSLFCVVCLHEDLRIPTFGMVLDWNDDYTTQRFINPHASAVQTGMGGSVGARTLGSDVTINGENDPADAALAWERGDIDAFNPYAGGSTFDLDSFRSRNLITPRTALWLSGYRPNRTAVRKRVCRGENVGTSQSDDGAQACNGSSSTAIKLQYGSMPSGIGAVDLFTRSGLFLAAIESSLNTGTSGANKRYEFYTNNVQMRTGNELGASIKVFSDDAQVLFVTVTLRFLQTVPIPFFFVDTFYDGESILPSLSLHLYNQYNCGTMTNCAGYGTRAVQADPTGNGDNDTSNWSSVDVRIAGGQVKICETNNFNVRAIMPLAQVGETNTLSIGAPASGTCQVTSSGISRPGSFAVGRVNDRAICSTSTPDAACNGKTYGRLFFPPWPNDTVELQVSAPGVAPLVYKRNTVR